MFGFSKSHPELFLLAAAFGLLVVTYLEQRASASRPEPWRAFLKVQWVAVVIIGWAALNHGIPFFRGIFGKELVVIVPLAMALRSHFRNARPLEADDRKKVFVAVAFYWLGLLVAF